MAEPKPYTLKSLKANPAVRCFHFSGSRAWRLSIDFVNAFGWKFGEFGFRIEFSSASKGFASYTDARDCMVILLASAWSSSSWAFSSFSCFVRVFSSSLKLRSMWFGEVGLFSLSVREGAAVDSKDKVSPSKFPVSPWVTKMLFSLRETGRFRHVNSLTGRHFDEDYGPSGLKRREIVIQEVLVHNEIERNKWMWSQVNKGRMKFQGEYRAVETICPFPLLSIPNQMRTCME